jgi:L,D-transpeptidase YcbB
MRSSVIWPRLVAIVFAGVIGTAIFVARRAPASAASTHRPAASVGEPLSSTGISALRAIAGSARNPDLRWPDFAPYKAEFAKFYASNGYSLRWIQSSRVSSQGLSVIELLKKADTKGLEPEDYDASRWAGRVAKLSQNPSEQDLVSFDTALTVSTMRYIRAVHAGRVNPKKFNFQLDLAGRALNLSDFLQTNVVNAANPAAEIQKIEPQFPGYKKLLALLPLYEGYAEKVGEEKLPPTKKTVVPGQPYAGAARLGRFLQLIGDIPDDTRLNPNATIYEGALVDGP